jgi:hypothetical protein
MFVPALQTVWILADSVRLGTLTDLFVTDDLRLKHTYRLLGSVVRSLRDFATLEPRNNDRLNDWLNSVYSVCQVYG